MKNLLMVLAAVLGTSVMVSAQTTPAKEGQAKEVKATKKHHKHKSGKKAKAGSSKEETAKVEK